MRDLLRLHLLVLVPTLKPQRPSVGNVFSFVNTDFVAQLKELGVVIKVTQIAKSQSVPIICRLRTSDSVSLSGGELGI